MKEIAMLRKETVLTYYIFVNSMSWKLLTKFEKSCVFWLIAYHHGKIG